MTADPIIADDSQSKNFPSATIVTRNDAVVRRGFILRSRNKASCFRRKRFSATSATRAQKNNRMNISKSVFYRNLSALLARRSNICGGQPHEYFYRTRIELFRIIPAVIAGWQMSFEHYANV